MVPGEGFIEEESIAVKPNVIISSNDTLLTDYGRKYGFALSIGFVPIEFES